MKRSKGSDFIKKKCTFCKKELDFTTRVCPYCYEKQTFSKEILITVVIILLFCFLIGLIIGMNT